MSVSGVAARRSWRLRDGDRALEKGFLAGILNVTPDSFHDGGKFVATADALARAEAMIREGADLVDVGAESTRPGALDVSAAEQIRRIEGICEGLAERGIAYSIDTRSAEVAAFALARGAVAVNDVSSLSDPEMLCVVADSGAGLVLMHAKGSPRTMQNAPEYDDVVSEVRDFLAERRARAIDGGVSEDVIAVDPGIGFGKTPEHNLHLLRSLARLAGLGPVYLGISRKSFLGSVGAGAKPADRLAGTLAATAWAWREGARIFRAHDVAETRRALSILSALEEEDAA